MGESHNDEYYSVEDQRFLGEEGFGEEIAREGGANEERKPRKSIETAFQEIAWQLETTPDALRGKDRRWEISKKRSGGLAGPGAGVPRVSEVADFLRRDPANISTMLSRLAAREQR